MTYVIAEPCIGVKDKSCVPACPVDCIAEGPAMLFIDPRACIDCDACRHVCPVQAIFPEDEVPEKWRAFVDLNAKFFEGGGHDRGRVVA